MTSTGARRPHVSRWDRILLAIEHHGNRRLRPLGTWLYRLTGGRIAPRGRDVLLLTTRGRRTGLSHTVLLQAFEVDGCVVLVAANAGRAGLPDWYRNLIAVGVGEMEMRGRRQSVRPEPVAPDAARALWPRILRLAPDYARFREAAGRELPLVRLRPEG